MSEKLNVNPTRMELQRQKGRMRTAKRGHKLLKDKSDEMIRAYMELVRVNKRLRDEVNAELRTALLCFMRARTQMTSQEIFAEVSSRDTKIELEKGTDTIMGMVVPKLKFGKTMTQDQPVNPKQGELGSLQKLGGVKAISLNTVYNFDESVNRLQKIFPKLLELAEVEKTCDMLASEIVRIKRRINALEFILMPQIENTIKFIKMKLAENERSQLVRVMKVKALTEGSK